MDFDVKKLSLKNGDILVLKYQGILPTYTLKRVNEYFKEITKTMGLEKVQLMVLEEKIELHGVIECQKKETA